MKRAGLSSIVLLCLVVLAVISGCSGAQDDELHQWMAQQKKQILPNVVPLSEPKQFKPATYSEVVELDPFNTKKLSLALKKEVAQESSKGTLITPELTRRKAPLEEFPLDTMVLVGSMVRNGKPVALVTVGKLLYQVQQGDYLGQNYGRITKITEVEIALREIVQDAVGEWVERTASLQLQERSK